MKNTFKIWALIITSTFVDAQDLGDPNCESLLLVSSWFNNNVKIYDGCNGAFIRNLADDGVLKGPQSIFQDSHGDLIVVSESNHKLIKFDQTTLSTASTVVAPGLMRNPITLVKKDNGNIYLGSYSSNEIIELNTTTWQSVRTVLPANNNRIKGIDIGMALGPDGHLYVPGYDSNSVLRVNPTNGNTSNFINTGSNFLDRPRSIFFNGNQMLITAWGKRAIYNYNLNGVYQDTKVNNLHGAAGITADGPGHILVTSDTLNTVRRYNLADFSFETIIPSNSGDLKGATFVYRLMKVTPTNETETVTDMQQAWITGVGSVSGKSILVEDFTATTGGAFGADFNPTDIQVYDWGDLLIEFTNCHAANMSYTSNIDLDGKPFGSSEYPVRRLAMNPPARACDDQGIEHVTNNHWMAGSFYGGSSRSGEGFTIDLLENDRAIVTWYTYLPKAQDR